MEVIITLTLCPAWCGVAHVVDGARGTENLRVSVTELRCWCTAAIVERVPPINRVVAGVFRAAALLQRSFYISAGVALQLREAGVEGEPLSAGAAKAEVGAISKCDGGCYQQHQNGR